MTDGILSFIEAHGLSVLQSVTSMLVIWGWWSLKRLFVTREDFSNTQAETDARFKLIEAKQAQRDNDMAAIRDTVENLPSQKTIFDISLKLAEIQGEMSRTCEELRGLREIVVRVENQTDLLYRKGLESEK